MGLRNYARWKYKDNIYWVLGLCTVKNQETRNWDKAVIYCREEQQDKIFVREINEFFSKFELMVDGFAPPDMRVGENRELFQKYGMPVVVPQGIKLDLSNKGESNGKIKKGKEEAHGSPTSHSTEEG